MKYFPWISFAGLLDKNFCDIFSGIYFKQPTNVVKAAVCQDLMNNIPLVTLQI